MYIQLILINFSNYWLILLFFLSFFFFFSFWHIWMFFYHFPLFLCMVFELIHFSNWNLFFIRCVMNIIKKKWIWFFIYIFFIDISLNKTILNIYFGDCYSIWVLYVLFISPYPTSFIFVSTYCALRIPHSWIFVQCHCDYKGSHLVMFSSSCYIEL